MQRYPLLASLFITLVLSPVACDGPDAGHPPGSGRSDGSAVPVEGAPGTVTDESGTPGEARGSTSADGEPSNGRSDRIRTVFLGTSLTSGLGLLRSGQRYTDRLQAMADSAGIPVEVVNAGVSGDTSEGGVRRLDWLLEEPLDVLVVEVGANDGLRGHPPSVLEENLRTIIRRARERYPDVRIALIPMEAPPNLGDDYTRDFREVYPRVAREMDVTLLPFLLEGVAGVPSLNQEDGIHPNPEGHAMIARTLWGGLEALLRDEAAESAGHA